MRFPARKQGWKARDPAGTELASTFLQSPETGALGRFTVKTDLETIEAIIESHPASVTSLMEVLLDIQEKMGWISETAVQAVCSKLGVNESGVMSILRNHPALRTDLDQDAVERNPSQKFSPWEGPPSILWRHAWHEEEPEPEDEESASEEEAIGARLDP
jgi:hypothetical protein